MNFLNDRLWKHKIYNDIYVNSLESKANKFYKIKTYERVNQYLETNNYVDTIKWINNSYVESIYDLLDKIEWKNLFRIFWEISW